MNQKFRESSISKFEIAKILHWIFHGYLVMSKVTKDVSKLIRMLFIQTWIFTQKNFLQVTTPPVNLAPKILRSAPKILR